MQISNISSYYAMHVNFIKHVQNGVSSKLTWSIKFPTVTNFYAKNLLEAVAFLRKKYQQLVYM